MSRVGLIMALGCGVPWAVQAQEIPGPIDPGISDAGLAGADAGSGLLPPGTGVCLASQGPCDANGMCEGDAQCAAGACYAPVGECAVAEDCTGGALCIKFGDPCSPDMACGPGEMCADTGQCIKILFPTGAPPGDGTDGAPMDGGVSSDGGATSGDGAGDDLGANAGDPGKGEATRGDGGASNASEDPKSSVSICSVGTPGATGASSMLGLFMLGLGAVLQRRRSR